MPTALSVKPNIKTRAFTLLIILLFSPLIFWGQKQLTGLWVGTLSNDSSTTRRDQSFEIALTEYRGKMYGYSRSEFIVNDTLYYILKRVKGTIDGDVCEVKDDKILSYNFRGKLDKGVKVISTFRMNKQDSTWYLDGSWKTNQTKKYYALTGKLNLKEETNYSQSKLFPHLEELNLADDVAFYKEQKDATRSALKDQAEKENTFAANNKTKEETTSVAINKQGSSVNANNPAVNSSISESAKKEVVSAKIANEPTKDSASVENKNAIADQINNKPRKKERKIDIKNPENKNVNPAEALTFSDTKKPELEIKGPAAFVKERNSLFSPSISFKSDSLELALYDNGEIDGDTVSVLLNGKIIIAQQCLKATAIKRTIYVTPEDGDSLTLVLYAENLGKYPPNTGLLVIHDGEQIYQVRFSADLQTNAAIILKRKRVP